MNRKIIITGATGLIGKELCRKLTGNKEDVFVFTRSVEKGKEELPFVRHFIKWDYRNPASWMKEVDGAYAVIHLAGANLFGKRWTKKYKHIILSSREESTRQLVHAIASASNKPEVFIASSAVGIYGSQGDKELTEDSSLGNDFLALVCKAWEYEAFKVEELGVRIVSLRQGIVLAKQGGALEKMITPYKFFIGGPLGSGEQFYPWIHIEDLINIYLFILDIPITGAINAAAPDRVTMKQLSQKIGKTLHRPSFFKVPGFILRIILGEGAAAILSSENVVPKRLQESGFQFKYSQLSEALENLIQN
jgi:uncharacterized protein (TIGR01777 family)